MLCYHNIFLINWKAGILVWRLHPITIDWTSNISWWAVIITLQSMLVWCRHKLLDICHITPGLDTGLVWKHDVQDVLLSMKERMQRSLWILPCNLWWETPHAATYYILSLHTDTRQKQCILNMYKQTNSSDNKQFCTKQLWQGSTRPASQSWEREREIKSLYVVKGHEDS